MFYDEKNEMTSQHNIEMFERYTQRDWQRPRPIIEIWWVYDDDDRMWMMVRCMVTKG